jgi:hypothetical protein
MEGVTTRAPERFNTAIFLLIMNVVSMTIVISIFQNQNKIKKSIYPKKIH